MQIAIVGVGGVGGYIGSKLLAAGADVVFVARGQRLADLSERGLIIHSPLGDFAAPVKAVAALDPDYKPDVVAIACKAPDLDSALSVVEANIGSGTRVLPFLNGVVHVESLHRRFPNTAVIAGIAHGGLTLRQDGAIGHLTPFFSSIVGPTSTAADPVAEEFVRLLSKAGVDARVSENIRRDLWGKFVFLTTLAGITCLMRSSIGTIMACKDGQELIVQLLEECALVARVEGFAPDVEAIDAYRRSLTEPRSTFTSSMLRDIQNGRHTEVEHILGDMLRRAELNRLATPLLKIANAHVQCFETAAFARTGGPTCAK